MNRLTVLTKTMKRLSMKMASPRAIGAPGRAGVLTVLIMGTALPLQAEQIAAPQTEQALPAPDVRVTPSLGEAVERQLPLYMDYQTWVQDPSRY